MSLRSHRFGIVGAALCMLLAILPAATLPVGAQQQNEIVLSVDFDGRSPNGDTPFAANTDGEHTPGQDDNANNNVVLTNDSIGYRIDWNVNEVDGTTTAITATLPEGMSWIEDPSTVTGVPAGCVDGPSSIIGNDGRDLVCVTDDEHEGSNGVIHPEAAVGAQFDDAPLALTATIATDQADPVDSNTIITYASGRPRADWIKGTDVKDNSDPPVVTGQEPSEVFYDVPGSDGSTLGRILVYVLRYEPVGGALGAEKLNDALPIAIFDHAWDFPTGTVLADGLMPPTSAGAPRTACGVYDGEAAFPIDSTGTWICTDQSGSLGYGYPVTEISITGHDTSQIPPVNGNFSPNTKGTMLAGQIAFWIPEANIAPYPTQIFNGISGSLAEVTASAELQPIQVHGSAASFDEAGVVNNFAFQALDEVPTEGSPGRSFRHTVKYVEGPFRSFFLEDANSGVVYESVDSRRTTVGGLGASVTDGVSADYPGWGYRSGGSTWAQTPRGNTLGIVADLQTIQTVPDDENAFSDPTSLCLNIDPTHQEIIPLPTSFDRAEADPLRHPWVFGASETIGGGAAAPNAGPLAQVYIGGSSNFPHRVWSYTFAPATNLGPEIPYVVEFGAGLVAPSNDSTMHGVTCNEGDVDPVTGWVDSAGDLSVFQTGTLADGTPVYGDITHVRLRTEAHDWLGPVGSRSRIYGTTYQLNLNVRVKDSTTAQAAGQELFVYASRAFGAWDSATDGQPPTPDCTTNVFQNYQGDPDDDNRYDPAGGWCNLPYTDNGTSSTDMTDTTMDFGGGGDSAWETCTGEAPNCYPRLVHADTVKIVEAQLAISKSNLAGLNDVNQNGDLVEFEVKPRVVGSSLDTISELVLTDTLPAFYEFVGFTQNPATTTNSDGSALTTPLCSVAGQAITCEFGTQVGGWSDALRYEVRVRDTGPNQSITNTVNLNGNDAVSGDAKTPAKATAKSFTAGPFEESGIIKFIDPHLGPCDLADDCSIISADGNIRFTLDVNNEGPTDLANYRVIDVLPHLGDDVEMASLTLTGDGRTPASLFSGDVELIAASAAGATVYYTGDNPAMISRDPDMSETVNTWCQTLGGSPDIGGGSCPADLAAVTGVYLDLGTLLKGETRVITLDLATIDNECGDVYTNNFGGRTDDILLPIRSNDVTATVGFCDPMIDIEKDTNGFQADNDPPADAGANFGPGIPVGGTVTWTYVVENTGDVALVDAVVSDSDPAVSPDCDIDGDDVFDGTDTIPLMLPGDTVTCQATGTSVGGQYTNDSSVAGTPVLPDFSDPDLDPAVDPANPSTWPVDPAAYVAPVDPVTGEPALGTTLEDADPSAYWGVPSDVGVDIEKDTNGDQADDTAGPAIPVDGAVTWTYVVENTGQLPIMPATVADSDPALSVVCDPSLADAGGDNIIDVFLPGESVTCTATGVATGGAYENTATVSGPTALPAADCVCDPIDPATWPTDVASFVPFVDEVTGEPVTVEDTDDSHYFGVGPDIDIEKSTNGVDSDEAPGEQLPAGSTVTWTYVVENTGTTALADATVTDDQGVVVDCDIDGDGTFDGTNIIPLMLPGDTVTCEGTGTAVGGLYTNNASVSGNPLVPDAALCGCDPLDSTTWPTDPALFTGLLGDDGLPVGPVTDEDPSNYTGTQMISGVVWDDADKDGIQDPSETVHAGVVVELLDENGQPVLDADGNPITAVTDANGYYEFNVPPGKYRLKFTPPAGTVITTGSGADNDADPSSATTGVIDVVPGVDVPDIDAGLIDPTPDTQRISGVVWDDADKDGIQDPGEKVYSGVVVELLDENGNPVLDAAGNPITTITDANGYYEFNVPPGKYRLRFTPPAGTSITGGSGADNDADPSSKTTGVIEVVAGVNVPGIDAGVVPSTPGTLAFTGFGSTGVRLALVLLAAGLLLTSFAGRRRLATETVS